MVSLIFFNKNIASLIFEVLFHLNVSRINRKLLKMCVVSSQTMTNKDAFFAAPNVYLSFRITEERL